MKFPVFVTIVTAALASGLSAATYTSNFNSMGLPGSDVAGQEGWTIDDTGDQYSQVAVANVNPAATNSFSNVINLGDAGAVATQPSGSSVTLSHEYIGTVGATNVAFDFVIYDSFTGPFAARDEFGFGISNGSNNLFWVSFVPELQSNDPSNDQGKWEVYYQVNNGTTIPLNLGVFELAQYHVNLNFDPNGINPNLTDFMLTITSAVPNTLSDGATGIALAPGAATGDFGISWAKAAGNTGYGSNSILVDNLSVVPEPSSFLLLSLASFGFVLRRKRA